MIFPFLYQLLFLLLGFSHRYIACCNTFQLKKKKKKPPTEKCFAGIVHKPPILT